MPEMRDDVGARRTRPDDQTWLKPVVALDIGPCLVETSTRQSRKAWIKANGPIPDGMQVLHKCDNKLCRRLDHLYLGTAKQNTADMIQRGRAGYQHMRANNTHLEIARRHAAGENRHDLAKEFGMYPESINRVVRVVRRHAK